VKRKQLESVEVRLPENQGQNLALTVVYLLSALQTQKLAAEKPLSIDNFIGQWCRHFATCSVINEWWWWG
jgi:hypothetical protein